MFRTVTVHPQELLCRDCICRLWYVVIRVLLDTSSWYNVVGRTGLGVVSRWTIYIYLTNMIHGPYNVSVLFLSLKKLVRPETFGPYYVQCRQSSINLYELSRDFCSTRYYTTQLMTCFSVNVGSHAEQKHKVACIWIKMFQIWNVGGQLSASRVSCLDASQNAPGTNRTAGRLGIWRSSRQNNLSMRVEHKPRFCFWSPRQ